MTEPFAEAPTVVHTVATAVTQYLPWYMKDYQNTKVLFPCGHPDLEIHSPLSHFKFSSLVIFLGLLVLHAEQRVYQFIVNVH